MDHPFLQKLEEYFKNTPKEQIEKDWLNILKDTDSEAYYKRKYKDSLERMKSWVKGEHPECFCEAQKAAEFIFPELKESEDELTWLTKYIEEEAYSLSMDIRDNEDRLKLKKLQRSLAWLKKQGEKKPNGWHSEDEQNLNATLSYIDDEYLRRWLKDIIHAKYGQCGGCVNNKGCVTCVDDNMKEQKVEPKFKAGDWIIGNEGIFKISQYDDDGGYNLTDTTGCVVHFVSPDYVESNFHLWTIQDAKDGDVLVGQDGRPFIFTGEFDVQDGNPIAYCGINSNDKFIIGKGSHWTFKGGIKPATKEQCDRLFAKMGESGYEWDTENKELKKIESKKLDASEVIEWLNHRELMSNEFINRFKKYFGL